MPTDDKAPRPVRGRTRRVRVVIGSGLTAMAALAVTAAAWTRPAAVGSVVTYTQQGRLSYAAATGPASVYGPAGLKTGQPVYAAVVRRLRLVYSYEFRAAEPARLTGTEELLATIGNGQGITRTIPLQPATAFTGTGFTARAVLSLAALQAVAEEFQQVSDGGIPADYPVVITASVHVRGLLGSARLIAAFDGPASFSYSTATVGSGGLLAPAASGPQQTGGAAATAAGLLSSGPGASGTSGQGSAASLTASTSGQVAAPGRRAAGLLPGLPVGPARVAGPALLALALAVGWLWGRPLLAEFRSRDERRRIAARHGTGLVRADALPEPPGLAVVQLSSFSGLLQVARRLECPVLHLAGDGDVYAVVDNGTLYRYAAGGA